MQSFYSPSAQCHIRFHDLPGHDLPCVFVHGLGCASSYEYPRVVIDTTWQGRRAILIAFFAARGIESAIVPAAGHSMSWENPQGLAGVLSAWLQKAGV